METTQQRDGLTRKRMEIRLSGSIQNLLLFGAIEVFRDRPKLRMLGTALGLLSLPIGVGVYALPAYPFDRLGTPLANRSAPSGANHGGLV